MLHVGIEMRSGKFSAFDFDISFPSRAHVCVYIYHTYIYMFTCIHIYIKCKRQERGGESKRVCHLTKIVARRYPGCTPWWCACCWARWCSWSVSSNSSRVQRPPTTGWRYSWQALPYLYWVSLLMYGKAFFRASSHLDVVSHKTRSLAEKCLIYVACIGEGIKCRVLANNSVESIPGLFRAQIYLTMIEPFIYLYAYDCNNKSR